MVIITEGSQFVGEVSGSDRAFTDLPVCFPIKQLEKGENTGTDSDQQYQVIEK